MEENKRSFSKQVKELFITTLNGMAYGLFATLIIGTIFATIGGFFKDASEGSFGAFMFHCLGNGMAAKSGISYVLQVLTGAGIGVGMALAMKLTPLQTVVLGVVGQIAGYFSLTTFFVTKASHPVSDTFQIGDPLTIYFVCLGVVLLFKYVLKKKTSADIIIVPLCGVIAGLLLSLGLRYPLIYVTYAMQWLVNSGTNAAPFFMGIIVAVLMGMALTAPISSAAIAAMIFLIPEGMSVAAALADPQYAGLVIASGAAVVGCSTQMVGFAIQSRRDNKLSMVFSIGIGTSMLQFKNIVRKPIVWLPTIITSAILGPIATCALKMCCLGSAAGMGTAGLVGQIGTIASMGVGAWQTWVGIFVLEIAAPIALVFAFDLLFRKLGWIKDGDLKV